MMRNNLAMTACMVVMHTTSPSALYVQVFMAVTASAASEQIAISTIVSYDIYRRYVNPRASGRQILLVGRYSILFWACISGVWPPFYQNPCSASV